MSEDDEKLGLLDKDHKKNEEYNGMQRFSSESNWEEYNKKPN